MNISTFFSIETVHLRLKIPSSADLPFVFSATRHSGFNDGMLWEAPDHPDELLAPLESSIKAWENDEAYSFTIEQKQNGQFLGRISIRPTETTGIWNVGFWTHPEQQGKGIMTEALGAVLHFGFTQLSATRIEACHALWNKASERVLQKNCLQFVRYIEEGFQKKGKWVEENLLAIDREDWMNRVKQDQILQKILDKGKDTDPLEWLTQKLSGSELNSLLLTVFSERVKRIQPSDLLRNYSHNRFVQAVPMAPIAFAAFELEVMKYVQKQGFELFTAGPVSPLGTCSVLGPVDQKKVISALRNTEVVADVTNVMALEVARRKQKNSTPGLIKLGALHRHIRAQDFDTLGFTPHFKILSLVSAGRDTGNYHFETESLIDHIRLYLGLCREVLQLDPGHLTLRGICLDDRRPELLMPAWERIAAEVGIAQTEIKMVAQSSNSYYQGFQFKLIWEKDGQQFEIIDGGRVDWTQRLLQNQKERMIISGLGLEFMYKLLRNEI